MNLKGWKIFVPDETQYYPEFIKKFPSGNSYSVGYVVGRGSGFPLAVHKNLMMVKNYGLMVDSRERTLAVFHAMLREMKEIEEFEKKEVKLAICPNRECISELEQRYRPTDSEPRNWYWCEHCLSWVYVNDVEWMKIRDYEKIA